MLSALAVRAESIVPLANELYKRISDKIEYGLKIEHRDIEKDSLRK